MARAPLGTMAIIGADPLTAQENDGFYALDGLGLIACPTGYASAVTGSSAGTGS
jgi:hypothetical protein